MPRSKKKSDLKDEVEGKPNQQPDGLDDVKDDIKPKEEKKDKDGKEEVMEEEKKMEDKKPATAVESAAKEANMLPDADGLLSSDAYMPTGSGKSVSNGMPEMLNEGEIAPVPSSIVTVPDMPTTIVPKSSFPTDLAYGVSGILRSAWFSLGMRIGDISTRDDYRYEFRMLALRVMEKYDGVYTNFDRDVEDFYKTGRVTNKSQAGFDYGKFAGELDAGGYQRFTSVWNEYHLPKRQIVESAANYFGLNFEAKMIKEYHRINQEYLSDLDPIYNLFRSMEDRYYFLAPLDPQLDRRFLRTWHDPRMTAYYDLFRDNRFLAGELYQIFRGHVQSSLTAAVSDSQMAIGRLQNAARIRVGQSSKWTAVPGSISQTKAQQTLFDLFTLKLVGEKAKGMMRYRVRQYDPVLAIDAIIAKLWIDPLTVDMETIVNIDNYINQWVLPICPGFREARHVKVPGNEKTHTTVNYLSQSLQAGAVPEPFASYFWTKPGGRGWNTAGGAYVKFDAISAKWMARNDQFMPFGGVETNDWSDTFPQLDLFNQVVDRLGRGAQRFPGGVEENSHNIFASIMVDISSMTHRMSEFVYYANLALRKASMNNIGMPSKVEGDGAADNFLIHLPTGGLLSMIYLIDGETISVDDFGLSFYKLGRNMHHVCNKLVEMHYFVKDTMSDVRYTRSERLAATLDLVPANPISNILKEKFGAKPNSHDVKWPDRGRFGYDASQFARKLKLAERVVLENAPLYGFATHFFFNPLKNYSTRANRTWREYYFMDGGMTPDITIGWTDLIRHVEFGTMKKLISDARANGHVIRFDIPVKINITHGTPPPNEMLAPINFKDISTSNSRKPGEITIRTLDIYYRLKEDFFSPDAIEHTVDVDPEWLSDQIPVILDADAIEPRSLHHFMTVYNEGWKVEDVVNMVHFIKKTG
jgi:hypothetical protein